MAFKDIWRPRVDGVDDADSSAVNEIAEAVIDNENANKKNATAILGKQDKLSKEQLENIDKVPDKQEALTEEQLQNIQDVPNKADADYVNNTFANALKGSAIGQSVNLTDVSPIEHTLDVKVQSKNIYPFSLTKTTAQNATFIRRTASEVEVKGANGSPYQWSSGWYQFYKESVTGAIDFTKDRVTVSMEVTLIEEGANGATFSFGHSTVVGRLEFTATTTPTRVSFTISPSALDVNGLYLCVNSNTLKIANIQFEYGTEATDYAPYMTDVTTATVKKYGKNLFDPNEVVNRTTHGITTTVQEDGGITFSGVATTTYRYFTPNYFKNPILLSPGTYTLSGHGKLTIQVKYLDGTSENFYGTFTLKKYGFLKDALLNNLTVGDEYNMTIYPSLVVGSVAEYEPYKEPVTYNVNADGTVEGVTSIYPTTTLLTDTGTVVDVTYNRDISKAFAELEQKLTNAVISLGGNV